MRDGWNRKNARVGNLVPVTAMKKISVKIPCYNEIGNIREMAETVSGIMAETAYEYEILFTDNGSTDGTADVLRELASKDQRIKVILNNRNYGLDGRSGRNSDKYVSGDAVITLPCDFQEPPELIPEFIKYWELGYKVVCGQKISSEEGKFKYACRDLFYKLINHFSDTPQHAHVSGINLIDREVLEEYLKSDYDIFLRFALADMGYKTQYIQYRQQKRRSGKSSYNVWRYLSFAITSMVTTSNAPLRIMSVAGLIMSFFSFLIGVVYLVMKLVLWNRFQAGMAPIMIGIFFLGSVQLLFIGLLGEYIGAILRKVTRLPDVIVSEKINL